MVGGPAIAKATIMSMMAPVAIDQASIAYSGKRRTSGRACSTLAVEAPSMPTKVSAMPNAIWRALAAWARISWMNSRSTPETATSVPSTAGGART